MSGGVCYFKSTSSGRISRAGAISTSLCSASVQLGFQAKIASSIADGVVATCYQDKTCQAIHGNSSTCVVAKPNDTRGECRCTSDTTLSGDGKCRKPQATTTASSSSTKVAKSTHLQPSGATTTIQPQPETSKDFPLSYAEIGAIAGGAAVALIALLLVIWYQIKTRRGLGYSKAKLDQDTAGLSEITMETVISAGECNVSS